MNKQTTKLKNTTKQDTYKHHKVTYTQLHTLMSMKLPVYNISILASEFKKCFW